MQVLSTKCQEKVMLNLEKNSITSHSQQLTHNQTLNEVPWLLRQEKPKKDKNFQKKLEKKLQCL